MRFGGNLPSRVVPVSAVQSDYSLRRSSRRLADRLGDVGLRLLTLLAALAAVALLGAIVWKVVALAWPAITHYGLSFVTGETWDPVNKVFGALPFIYGTAISSLIALVIATPLAIAIALWLSELAPGGARGVIGSLVELLAAIPSVVIGLWGVFVLGPFLHDHLAPFLHRTLGWTPFFSGQLPATGNTLLTAVLVLTIMIIPITASIARELFLAVPDELEHGALALGLTRWEMIRGVVLPYTRGGVVAAVILGTGRAIGEAIAVTQVIGGLLGIHISLFESGDTLASRIAAQYQGAASDIQVASLVYLALILLVISLITNFAAQLIVRRFEFERVGAD
jgi:phosphate transport system permease protein